MKDDGFFRSSNILIAGLGLIGGSVAKALKNNGYDHLFAYDSDTITLKSAVNDGVVTAGYSRISGDIPAFDTVVCCLPPCAVAGFYDDIKMHVKDGGVFCELGGLKTKMIHHLTRTMKKTHELLCLHPMAGSEKTGYTHSNASLFKDSMLILTPTEKTGGTARSWANALAQVMNCAQMHELSADKHDEIIANISHIPHIAALAIKAMNAGNDFERFAGGSYRAVTRVADINSALWAGLLSDNREYCLKSIAVLKKNIDTLEKAIEDGDSDALRKLLQRFSCKKDN